MYDCSFVLFLLKCTFIFSIECPSESYPKDESFCAFDLFHNNINQLVLILNKFFFN